MSNKQEKSKELYSRRAVLKRDKSNSKRLSAQERLIQERLLELKFRRKKRLIEKNSQ